MDSNVLLSLHYFISPLFCRHCFFPPLVEGGCEPINPALPEVGGRGLSWRWCRCSVFFVAVEEEGQGSESCGGRFGALSGQQLQHLLPLNSNHTGCYCS